MIHSSQPILPSPSSPSSESISRIPPLEENLVVINQPTTTDYSSKNEFKSEQTPQNQPERLQQQSLQSDRSLTLSLQRHSNWYDRFRFSTVQLALLGLLALQSVAVISILSITVAKIEKEIQFSNPQLRTISTYLAIFIIANIFLILMTIDLLLNKNVVQLIALCAFNSSMAVYGAVLPTQIQKALHNPGGPVSYNGAREGTSCNMYLSCFGVQYLFGEIEGWIIAIPVISGIVSVLMAYLTWLIYKEFGWEIFKLIGADLGLKRILQKKYLFHMLQKFAFFFFIGLSLQFLMLASGMSSHERILTICAVPFSLAVIMLGGIAVSREIRWMMGIYYVCWAGATVYFIYKLVRLYNNESISAAVRSLTIFSVLTIALLFATGIVSALCYVNFGKGLLETPAVWNESLWSRFWTEKVARNGQDRAPSNAKATGNRRRMTLTGRRENEDEDHRTESASASHQLSTQSDMIQLKKQSYRMSMD